MKTLFRALVGLLLVFVVHIPKLLGTLLLISYAAVFNNRPTLTADPSEHLKRARKILRRGRRSEFLYAALEIRFALERMAQRELIFADAVSNRILQEPDPTKKVANLQRLDPESAFAQSIWFIDRTSGKRFRWAEYKPLDKARVSQIQGRLGDLLHPKEGLPLGLPDSPWYVETRRTLEQSHEYLQGVLKNNSPFFSYRSLDNFEMVRNSDGAQQ